MPQLRYRFDSASVENAGPFHAQVGPAQLRIHSRLHAPRRARLRASCGQIGMREADMRDQAFAEKRRHPAARAVDKLIGDHEIERLVLFLERPHRAQRKNPLHAQRLESVNVRAEIQLRRRNAMALARAAPETRPPCPPAVRRRKGPRARPTAFRSSRSWCASNPGIEYNPLPPMIPMLGFIPVSVRSARRRWRTDARKRKDVRPRRRAAHSAAARPRLAAARPTRAQIGHANRNVMQSFAALVEKLSDHGIGFGRLQQLDARLAQRAASRR